MAAGDFDGDGYTDLAVEVFTHVFILLSNGDGTFRQSADLSLGHVGGQKLLVGDFNSDGHLDLLLVPTIQSPYGMVLVLGNGDGTFRLPFEIPLTFVPNAVALGDFNGDGKLDIVLSSQQPNGIAIFLGNGDGTFQPPRTSSAVASPTAIVVGDFDNDGKLDVAVTSSPPSPFPPSVLVFLGNGDGSLRPGVSYPVGSNPVALAAADLNADGFTDLAVVNQGSNSVSILLNSGNGTFQAGLDFATGSRPTALAIADFDGDGRPDLATVNAGTNNVSVLLNQGRVDTLTQSDPGIQTLLFFSAPVDFGAGKGAQQLAAGDFNADGRIDLAVLNVDASSLLVLLNNTPIVAP
jgi:hypothetical protein